MPNKLNEPNRSFSFSQNSSLPSMLKRSVSLNQMPIKKGPVVYWMYRDQRLHDNWALLRAQEIALAHSQPLLIMMAIREDLTLFSGSARWFEPMVAGMSSISIAAHRLHIPFVCLVGDPLKDIPAFLNRIDAGAVVCDFSPLTVPRSWQKELASKSSIYWECVDTHNIVPVWVTSNKQEYAARTIRSKLYAHLDTYLVEYPKVIKHPYTVQFELINAYLFDQTKVLSSVKINKQVASVATFKAGEEAAVHQLEFFLHNKMSQYSQDRNDPTKQGVSNLSGYLHFGMISAARVVLELERVLREKKQNTRQPAAEEMQQNSLHNSGRNFISSSHNNKSSADIFFEEIVVRRELSDNYCFYNQDYASLAGAPDWAQKTLTAHTRDAREHIYSLEEFEQAQTHDAAWNAAQQELLQTGKMHGYMRMYWAKKILEWSKNPQEAIRIAIYLNDLYEIDGRDPNGYVGILWSIAGLHDRPWFERPVYGTVRYMNANGLQRKFDLTEYIQSWINV